ncbi:uncharacterized protein [Venturia canescens]|uniref:uncharacterized protein n=1 Tax=Venturia canescens TaxID=32260 RepID=UPI001C9CF2FF|nr:uncharacterized protein LOC122412433 [Venturia canescens]
MSKVTIILCVAIFASAANGAFVSDQLQKAQESLNNLIESTIARVKSAVADAKARSEELGAQLEAQIEEHKKRITEDVESKVRQAAADVNKYIDSIKGEDVSECSKLVDHLQATAQTAVLQVRKCFVDKRATGAGYIENMMKVADEVLASLHIHKLEAHACIDNVDGFISAGKAVVCTNLVAAKAGWTTAKAVPAVTVEAAKLTFLLSTLPSSLGICTATSALNAFYYEAFGIVEDSTKCVRQRIEEVRNRPGGEHVVPPSNAAGESSKPEAAVTRATDAVPTTEEVFEDAEA